MKRCKIYLMSSCLLGGVAVWLQPLWAAQGRMAMSLNEAIMLSLRYSPLVKSAEIQRVVDKFNLSVAKNQFEFQYALTGSANQLNTHVGGAPLDINGTYNLTPSISKETAYGTQYNLSMSNPVTYNKIPGQQSTYYNPAVTLQVVQPILQGSGREVVQANLVQAINTEKFAEIAYKAAIMNKITQVVEDYRNVVAAENSLYVAQDALKTARQNVKDNKVRIRLGFMAPSENVQALSFVASEELQLASAEYTLLQTKLTLLNDIGLSPQTPLVVNKRIDVTQLNYPKGEEAKRILLTNNPSYLQAELVLKNAKLQLLQAEDLQRWSLNLTGTVVQGAGVGGGPNAGIPSIYNGFNNSRNLGLELSVPIDNLPVQQQLVNAKVAYTQAELALKDLRLSLETTMLTQLENLRILFMQVKIAKEAERLAYQSYKDSLTKVRFGQSSMFEVTTLQSTYISNQLTTINTEIAYLNGVAAYQVLLGITLDEWRVKLIY